jgi:hypothetical protein
MTLTTLDSQSNKRKIIVYSRQTQKNELFKFLEVPLSNKRKIIYSRQTQKNELFKFLEVPLKRYGFRALGVIYPNSRNTAISHFVVSRLNRLIYRAWTS